MSNIKDFIGGSGGGLNPLTIQSQVFTTSGTFTAPKAGKFIVVASGGGGSGASARYYGYTATGGWGGELKSEIVTLANAEVVTVTIGLGGASIVLASNASTIGNDGGTTNFGTYVTALGGSGGINDSYSYTGLNIPSGKVGTTFPGFVAGQFNTGLTSSLSITSVKSDSLVSNLFGLLSVNFPGGINNVYYVYGTSYNGGFGTGGGAGVGGKGGDGALYTAQAGGGYGAGGGGSYTPAYTGTSTSGAGGDGVVYVFWEK